MPSNPNDNFIAIIIFLIGLFLFISGLNIIKIEKITVSNGLKTWVTGLVLMLLGGYIGTQKIIEKTDKIQEKAVLLPIEIKKTKNELDLERKNIKLIETLNKLNKDEAIRKKKEIADIQKKYEDLLKKEKLRKQQDFEEMVLFKKKQKELKELKNSFEKQNSSIVLEKSEVLNAELKVLKENEKSRKKDESKEIVEADKLEKELINLKKNQKEKLVTAQKEKLSFQSNVNNFIEHSNKYEYKKTWQFIKKLTMKEMRKNEKFKHIKNEADAYKNYEQFWKNNKAKFSLLEINTETNVIILLIKFTSGKTLQNTYLLEKNESSVIYEGWRIKERVKREVVKK